MLSLQDERQLSVPAQLSPLKPKIKIEESQDMDVQSATSSPEMVIQSLHSAIASQQRSISQSQFVGQAYLPSKRASAMVDAAKENQSNASEPTKKSKLDIFDRVKAKEIAPSSKRMNFFDDLDSSQLLLPDMTMPRGPVTSSKLLCLICQEKATNPCAGICGHVCCEECWTMWLATKTACPVCREPTTKESISKLIIR